MEKFYIPRFVPKRDTLRVEIDGKQEELLNTRGIIQVCYGCWKKHGNEYGRDIIREYCEYLFAHGYKEKSAGAILASVERMGFQAGLRWCRKSHAMYVKDEDGFSDCLLKAGAQAVAVE